MTANEVIKKLNKKNEEYWKENYRKPSTIYISENLCDILLRECAYKTTTKGKKQIFGYDIEELETPDCIYFGG